MDLASIKNGINSPTIEGLRNKGQAEKILKKPSLSKISRQDSLNLITDSLKDYTWEEKFEWMHQKLLKAERLFNKKRIESSSQLCLEALVGLDLNCSDENQRRQIIEIQIPCLLMMASCMRLKKEYAQGINYCNKAIELNRNNPQSYITRGLILQSLKEYKQALSDFKAAQKLAEEVLEKYFSIF